MSNISKLTTLAAAGAGGAGGFVLQRTDAAATFTPSITKVCVDSSGNIITVSQGTQSAQYWYLYKTDADGTEIWSKYLYLGSAGFGTAKLLKLAAITTDSTDAIILVGEMDPGTVYRDFSHITKITSSGVVSWSYNVRMASYGEWFSGVAVDSSDNIYVCGTFADDSNGYVYSGCVRKYNSSGVIQFIRRIYQSQSYMYITGIALDSAENIYVCGDVQNTSDGSKSRHLLIKMNSSAVVQWKVRVDPPSGSQNQQLFGVTVDSSDNIYVNGRTYTSGVGANGWVAKFNTSGVIQWQQEVDPGQRVVSSHASFYSNMTSDSSDNIYYVVELTDRFYVASFDSSGTIRFSMLITDPNSVNTYYGYGCAVTADDELILGGRINSSTASSRDTLTIKMPNDGVSGTFGAFDFSSPSTTVTATTFTTSTSTNVAGDSDLSTLVTPQYLTNATITETLTSL